MGGHIETNDTLRISKKQGFPDDLDIETHLKDPYKLTNFKDNIYEFTAKPKIRVYQSPPVRNFLVEDIDGKWVYWGLVHIIEINHDYYNKITSGKFKIIYLNTPEEVKKSHQLIDRNVNTDYFNQYETN